MPAQRLVFLATANLFIHHSHNLCLAKSKLWSRQTTLAVLPCKPSLGHVGGVFVGFLSPTPTTCRTVKLTQRTVEALRRHLERQLGEIEAAGDLYGDGAYDGGDAAVRGETGDQTDQESSVD